MSDVRRTGGLLAAIGLALLAQWGFDRAAPGAGLALAILAAVICGFASRGLTLDRIDVVPEPPEPSSPLSQRRLVALAAGTLLAVFGVSRLAVNAFTLPGTLAWLAGLGVCLFALDAPPTRGTTPASRVGAAPAWLALTAIVGLAALLRLYQLADLPAEAGCDIPLKLEIVHGILAGERPIFSPVFPGREVGFFYVTALYGAVFGADQFALKLISALCSLATVWALYALGTRWFGRDVGLAAAACLAVSAWHVSISRIGYRAVLTPVMVVLALLVLDRALTRGARRDWVRLGLVLGLCAYTYTASLAIPFAAAGVCLAAGLRRGRVGGWAAALLVATLVALPVVRLAVNDVELVTQRPRSRLEGPPYAVGERLLENGVRSLAMFNVHGDLISAQNVPGRRQLGLVSGALFLCGLGVAALGWRQPRLALVLWFLLVMQLPSALALAFPQDVPGAVRASGTLIPVCLLSALPVALLWRSWRQAPSPAGWRGVGIAAVAGSLLVTETGETWHRYFVEYPTFQSFGNYPLSRTIAAAMDGYAGRGPVYLPGYPYWLDGKALRVQLQRLPIGDLHDVHPDAFAAEVGAASAPLMVVLRPDDTERLAALAARFPNGRVTPYAAPSGEAMFVVFVTGP